MIFRFTTAGESHGKALITVIEGLPAGLNIELDYINNELIRRQKGYGRGHRMKIESDRMEVVSGVCHGFTLGSPVAAMIVIRDFSNWQDVMSSEPIEFTEEKK